MKNKGFTLIELMGIVIVLILIALVTIPSVVNLKKNMEDKDYERYLKDINMAVESYIAINKDKYPELEDEGGRVTLPLKSLVTEGYIRIDTVNPKTKEEISDDEKVVVIKEEGIFNYYIGKVSNIDGEERVNLNDVLYVNKVEILGDSYQEVTDAKPSVSIPSPITSVGDDNLTLRVTGRNLIKGLSTPLSDTSYWGSTNRFKPLEDGWGHFEYDCTSCASTNWQLAFVDNDEKFLFEPDSTYTICAEFKNVSYSNTSTFNVYITSSHGSNATSDIWLVEGSKGTVVNPQEGQKICEVRRTKSQTNFNNVAEALRTLTETVPGAKISVDIRISIYKGEYSDAVYEPYEGYEISYPTSLRKISGVAQDKLVIDNLSEQTYIEREVTTYVVDGTQTLLSWVNNSSTFSNFVTCFIPSDTNIFLNYNPVIMTEYFKKTNDLTGVPGSFYIYAPNGGIHFGFPKAIASNVQQATAWFVAHPTTIYYPLKSMQREELTYMPLQPIGDSLNLFVKGTVFPGYEIDAIKR